MSDLRPGDFLLVQRRSLLSSLIRLVTRSEVSHAAVVVDSRFGYGCVMEALRGGATFTWLKAFGQIKKVGTGRLPLTDEQRDRVRYAAASLEHTPYGFLDLLSVGLLQYGITNRWLSARVRRQDRLICSQLVDELLRRIGFQVYDDARWPGDVTPGDLFWTAAERGWIT
jgi:hypothetical protein